MLMADKATAPAFSVVLATYNRSSLVGRAIRSVLNQTFTDFELIIVDDGSADETSKVVQSFDDNRIKYVQLAENVGQPAAKNIGLRRTQGKYLTIIDSDDEFLPGFLEEVHDLLSAAGDSFGFAFVNNIRVRDTENGEVLVRKVPWMPPESRDNYLYFLNTRLGGTGYGLTIRRECLDEVGGFDEVLASVIDKDLIIRLAEKYGCKVSPRYLYKTHLHEGGRITDQHRTKIASYKRIYAKHIDTLNENPNIKAQAQYKMAWLHHRVGDEALRRKCLAEALKIQPANLKFWAAFIMFELFGSSARSMQATLSGYKKAVYDLVGGSRK